MKPIITIGVIALLLLSACQSTPTLIKEKLVVAEVPNNLWDCPEVKSFPNPDTLTDKQVAALLLTYAKNNKKCVASVQAVRAFLARQKEIIEHK